MNTSARQLTLNLHGRLIDLSVPKVMGILNVTPDSFYDGKRYANETDALRQVEKMLAEGADFVDVGGYSSRPGAEDVSQEEEIRRSVPIIKSIAKQFPGAIISIDTFRHEVARQALDGGASIINDISGGEREPSVIDLAASRSTPFILMHMRGTPQNMNQHTDYDNLVKDIIDFFHRKIYDLTQKGIKDIIIDPGFGFAKTVEQNFELLKHFEHFRILGKPVLAGLSRKSMIWRTLQITPDEALNGSTALNMAALMKGASILRVHDVKEAKECIRLAGKLTA